VSGLPSPSPSSTCLITGASSGIGSDLARELARRGHGVTLVARRKERLKELADELEEEHGVRADTVACDVTKPAARGRLIQTVAQRGLTVEVLVNNAGFGSGGSFWELDGAREASMVQTNVEAVVALSRAYLSEMVGRGRGAILNLGSTIAFQPVPFQATYGATKAFVLSFTESLHEELRGTGVTVAALCPGPVRTEFGQEGGFGGADDLIPSFMWLTPEEVARAGIEGLDRGQRVVVPGIVNWAQSVGGRLMPRWLLLPLARRVWPVS
jgi:short-subunit dehydrogenase